MYIYIYTVCYRKKIHKKVPHKTYLKNSSLVTKWLSQGKTLRAKAQMQKPCFQAACAQDQKHYVHNEKSCARLPQANFSLVLLKTGCGSLVFIKKVL